MVGDVLVGADGTNSTVRAAVVLDARIEDVGESIYGRTPIETGTLESLPPPLVDSFNRVIGPDGTAMSVATCRTWEPTATAAARLAPSARLTEAPGYLSWMVSVPDPLEALTPSKLHELARRRVTGWHPCLARILDAAEVQATFAVTLSPAGPVRRWQTGPVTLLATRSTRCRRAAARARTPRCATQTCCA